MTGGSGTWNPSEDPTARYSPSYDLTDASQGEADLIREYSPTLEISSPPAPDSYYLTTLEDPTYVRWDQEDSAHDLEPCYVPSSQDPEMEPGYYPVSYTQALGSTVYPQEETQDTSAPYEWEGAFPYTGQDGPTVDYNGNQHSPQELNYDHGTHDDGIQLLPASEEARQLYHANMGLPEFSGHAPEKPISLDSVDGEEHPDRLISHLAGIVGGQVTALIPAKSPPVEPDSVGTQNPSKRRRETTPDQKGPGERERIEHSQKKHRNFETQKYIPADPSIPLRGRPDLRAVRQIPYHCGNTRKIRTFLPPIDFTVQGSEGIKLTDATNLNYSHLDNRDDLMFVDERTRNSVSLRIEFVGCQSGGKTRQIATKNYKKVRGPITRQKLGQDVAKLVKIHLEEGSPFDVPWGSMYLVRLHNVSDASWQPELWYKAS